jgi:hypothetical protein
MSSNFPVDKFYVCHFTNRYGLHNIIESRSLQPPIIQKKLFEKENPDKKFWTRYLELMEERGKGDLEKYMKSIFYTILFTDDNGDVMFKPKSLFVYFIFSPKIIEDNAKMVGSEGITEVPVFCRGWNFATVTKQGCKYYNPKQSLKKNLNKFRKFSSAIIDRHTEDKIQKDIFQELEGVPNIELLMEGEMPIDMDLLHIYVPEYDPSILEKYFIDHPHMREKFENLENLMKAIIKENPDLPWTRENPFK